MVRHAEMGVGRVGSGVEIDGLDHDYECVGDIK